MTNIRTPKRYENVWTKTIAVLLLIALCIGMLWIGYQDIRMADAGIFNASEYLDSSQAYWNAESYAIDIEGSYLSNRQSVSTYENHNFAFTVFQTDAEGNYQPVYTSRQECLRISSMWKAA